MKKGFFVALAFFILVSCVPLHRVSDEELLRFAWQNHAWQGLSFSTFRESIHWKRAELDLDGDGRDEIAFMLTSDTQNSGDFLIVSAQAGHLIEWFFTRKTSHYALEMDFEPFENGLRLRWLERNGGSNVRVTSLHEEFIRCANQACASLPYERYSWAFSFGPSEAETNTTVTVTHVSFKDDMATLEQSYYQTGVALNRQTCYDQTGTKWGISSLQPYTHVGPEILTVYRWNGQSFTQISRRETRPQAAITPLSEKNFSLFRALLHVLHDRWYSGVIVPDRIEQDFLRFFGLETPHPAPCGESAPISLASGSQAGIGLEVVRAGQGCRLQVWKQPDWRVIGSVDEIEILGWSDFPCNPNTILLTWRDLTADGAPEAWVSSTDDFRETLRFFQITPEVHELGQISGFLREPNFRGVEWEERGERFLFYTGRPFWNHEACRTSLSCYSSLEPAFDCQEWHSQERRFYPCSLP